MKHRVRLLTRYAYALLALGAFVVPALPIFTQTAAAAQVSTRSIQLSTSTPSAASVSYQLTFTPVTTEQELIVDFCGDTPLVGSTCAFAAGTVPNVTGVTSSVGTAATVGSGSPVHTIKVTGLTMTGGSPFTITFSGLTNPSTATSFYARVLTYATGNATGYAPANTTGGTTTTGTYVDYGGVALSTASQITISASVMETLTFCVSGSTITTCGTTTTPSLTIGHGTPQIIDSTAVDVASAYTQLSTNATSGAIVRMKASNSCANGGLSSSGGATCNIPGLGSTAAVMAAGTADFGLCVGKGTNTTVATNYNDSVNSCPTTFNATSKYGMNGTNLTSTYGDQVFSTAGPVSGENNRCTFAATAATTTQAGIYTGNESLIATGTF
ncbi:MAG: hypothetical protein ACREBW_00310 [Candidatus Micrarchaeaceae archaeon]